MDEMLPFHSVSRHLHKLWSLSPLSFHIWLLLRERYVFVLWKDAPWLSRNKLLLTARIGLNLDWRLSGFRADAANTFKQFLSFLSDWSICVPGEVMLTLTSLLIWLLWKGECQDIYVIMRYCSGLKLARISRLWAALNFKWAAHPKLFLKAAHSFS